MKKSLLLLVLFVLLAALIAPMARAQDRADPAAVLQRRIIGNDLHVPALGHSLGHGGIHHVLNLGQLILGQRAAGKVGDDEARRRIDVAVVAEAIADDERLDALVADGLQDVIEADDGNRAEQFKEKLGAGTLFPKRLGKASEYASLALELLRNSYINGESVRIDSGMRMQPK